MAWQQIQPLPEALKNAEQPELAGMKELWYSQKKSIEALKAFEEFNKQVSREFAIETGLIEGLYSLDRGITQTLIEQGFDAALIPHDSKSGQKPIQVIRLLRDQESALQSLFDYVRDDRSLTLSYVKELHAQLTQNQKTTEAIDQFGNIVEVELLRGDWKQRSNNPTMLDGTVYEYAPPEHVASEMENLCNWFREYIADRNIPIEVTTAWVHHRFTQIHPFQDGNGRVARALASLALIKEGLFPFTVQLEKRGEYIQALESADEGDLQPLIDVVSNQQLKALRRALSIAERVERSKANEQVLITAAIDRLKDRFKQEEQKYEKVFDLENSVFKEIEGKIDSIVSQINQAASDLGVHAYKAVSNENNAHYFGFDVIRVAKELGYFANWKKHHRWAFAGIEEKIGEQPSSTFQIMFSAHPIGHEFRGGLVVSAFSKKKISEEKNDQSVEIEPLSENTFTFFYNQDLGPVLRSLSNWLDSVMRNGLAQWQKGL